MCIGFSLEQQPTRLQILDDEWISVFDEDSAPWLYFGNKCPIRQNGHQYWQIVLLRHFHVFLTECRSQVDKSCTILCGHKIAQHNIMRRLIRRQKSEERVILHILQFLTLERLLNL